MGTTISNGLINADEGQIDVIKPNQNTSVVIQDADGNDRLTVDADGVTIAGTTTTVDVATVTVDDKNVEINAVASPTDANADGGGLTLKGSTDKTIAWTDSTDAWHFNQGINVTSGDVGIGTTAPARSLDVLNADGNPQGRFSYNAGNFLEIGVEDNTGTGIIKASGGKLILDPTTTQANGSLGVGTGSPARSLDVMNADGNPQGRFSYNAGNYLEIGVEDNTGAGIIKASGGKLVLDPTTTQVNGNLGIGLSTPKTKLTVEGAITLKEQAAADTDTADYGMLWTKTATPNQLYFTTDAGDDIQLTSGTAIALGTTSTTAELDLLDGGTAVGGSITIADADGFVINDDGTMKTIPASDIKTYAGGGDDRYSMSERYKVNALGDTANVYFVGDVASDAGQFATSLTIANGSTISVDQDWISGKEASGLGWQAPRNVTLTKICCTAYAMINTNQTGMVVNVFKGTPVNDQVYTTDVTLTRIGQATMSVDGDETVDGGDMTDTRIYTINKTISSGNSISAGDMVIIGFSAVGAGSQAGSFANVTLEYTVA